MMKKQSKKGTAKLKGMEDMTTTVPGMLNMPPKMAKAMKVGKMAMRKKYNA